MNICALDTQIHSLRAQLYALRTERDALLDALPTPDDLPTGAVIRFQHGGATEYGVVSYTEYPKHRACTFMVTPLTPDNRREPLVAVHVYQRPRLLSMTFDQGVNYRAVEPS